MLRISRLLKIIVICFGLFVYVGIVAIENRIGINNETLINVKEDNLEIFGKLLKLAVRSNLFISTDSEKNERIPTDVLNEVYTECVLELSFPCLQKKLIAFLYKLDMMKNISLIGRTVLLVRKSDETGADTTTLSRVAEHVNQAHLRDVIDNLIDKFFENHSLRLQIPDEPYFDEAGNRNEGIFFDINFGSSESSHSLRESRSRRPRNRHKGIKKLMMLIGLMTCVKLTMLGPLMLGLLGLKAMKALILAVISLTISKMIMLSKVNMHSLFHGNDWYSSGGSSWDRNMQETSITSTLPYNMEPPAAYSTYTVRTVK